MATLESIRRAVSIIHDRQQAEETLRRLREAGFDMNHVCLVTKSERDGAVAPDDRKEQGEHISNGAAVGSLLGTVSGTLAGLLIGIGTLLQPGLGLVLTFETVGAALAATLSGSAIGAVAGSLAGALVGLGIPEENIETYNEAILRGDYLLVIDGTPQQIEAATRILDFLAICEYGIFDAPAGTTVNGTPLAERVREQLATTIVR